MSTLHRSENKRMKKKKKKRFQTCHTCHSFPLFFLFLLLDVFKLITTLRVNMYVQVEEYRKVVEG